MANLVYRFVLTPRERWELANIFRRPDLKLTTMDEKKTFNRTRRALGLAGVMGVMESKPRFYGSQKMIFDTAAKHRVEVTEQQADFLMKKILPLIDSAAQNSLLENFIEALDSAVTLKKSADVDESVATVPDIEAWEDPDAEHADKCPECEGTGSTTAGEQIRQAAAQEAAKQG